MIGGPFCGRHTGITPADVKIKILESSFKSREHFQKKEHGPSFEASATEASLEILTLYGDKSLRKAYCNFWTCKATVAMLLHVSLHSDFSCVSDTAEARMERYM